MFTGFFKIFSKQCNLLHLCGVLQVQGNKNQSFLPLVMDEQKEGELVTELEKQLFDKAVEQYSDMVTGLCLLRLGNRQDAEDCYQNVFMKLYRNMEMLFKDAEHLKAWLITVTVNECKNVFRFRIRHRTEPLEAVNSFYEDEHDRQLMEQIMKLQPVYREAIYLHYYMGYSVTEAARLTGSREGTVKSRLKRGRDLLKKMLTDDEPITGQEELI